MRIYTAGERDIVRHWLEDNLRVVDRGHSVKDVESLRRCIALLDHEDSMEESHHYAMKHDP